VYREDACLDNQVLSTVLSQSSVAFRTAFGTSFDSWSSFPAPLALNSTLPTLLLSQVHETNGAIAYTQVQTSATSSEFAMPVQLLGLGTSTDGSHTRLLPTDTPCAQNTASATCWPLSVRALVSFPGVYFTADTTPPGQTCDAGAEIVPFVSWLLSNTVRLLVVVMDHRWFNHPGLLLHVGAKHDGRVGLLATS